MAAMAGSPMRSSYEKHFSISPFYSGGKIHVMRDGCHVMSMCYSSVKMFNLSTLTIVKSFEEEEDTPLYLSVSPDESMLVVSWRSLLVKQYDLSSDTCIRQWKGHLGPVVAMDIDPSSTLLATGRSPYHVTVM
jgi:U3 small nucleolar RNA-associated protein 13